MLRFGLAIPASVVDNINSVDALKLSWRLTRPAGSGCACSRHRSCLGLLVLPFAVGARPCLLLPRSSAGSRCCSWSRRSLSRSPRRSARSSLSRRYRRLVPPIQPSWTVGPAPATAAAVAQPDAAVPPPGAAPMPPPGAGAGPRTRPRRCPPPAPPRGSRRRIAAPWRSHVTSSRRPGGLRRRTARRDLGNPGPCRVHGGGPGTRSRVACRPRRGRTTAGALRRTALRGRWAGHARRPVRARDRWRRRRPVRRGRVRRRPHHLPDLPRLPGWPRLPGVAGRGRPGCAPDRRLRVVRRPRHLHRRGPEHVPAGDRPGGVGRRLPAAGHRRSTPSSCGSRSTEPRSSTRPRTRAPTTASAPRSPRRISPPGSTSSRSW